MTIRWDVVLGLAISTLLILLIVLQVDVPQLAHALQAVHYPPLLLAMGIFVGTQFIRMWRWRYLLRHLHMLPMIDLFSAIAIGFMANMLLPAHAGEVVRAYLAGQKSRTGTVANLASIVMEKATDLLGLLVLLVLILTLNRMSAVTDQIAESFKLGGGAILLLSGLLGGSLWFIKTRTAQLARLLQRSLAFLPPRWLVRLTDALHAFASGLQALQTGSHLVAILVLSTLMWLMITLSTILILHACGLTLSLQAAFFIVLIEILGVAIPSAPGFVGTYHAVVVAGLMVLGVAYERALGMAIIMHATFFTPFILMGIPFLWRESLSFRDLWTVQIKERLQ